MPTAIRVVGIAILVGSAFGIPARANDDVCWSVYQADEVPDGSGMADEVICWASADATAKVQKSDFYGSAIEGCNTVTALQSDETLNLTIDFSACSRAPPSHKLACQSLSAGQMKCTWNNTADINSGEPIVAYMLREKISEELAQKRQVATDRKSARQTSRIVEGTISRR